MLIICLRWAEQRNDGISAAWRMRVLGMPGMPTALVTYLAM